MGNIIYPTELNGSTYIMVKNGLVEDVGCAFTSLTGYGKLDFYQKNIQDVMLKLFGFDIDRKKDSDAQYYLFKKSYDAIEVRVSIYQIGKEDQKLYLFQQVPNFILDSELSFVCKMLKENYVGVGLYSCPDYRLLKTNKVYLEYMQDAYQTGCGMVSQCLSEIIPDYAGSKMESMLLNISKTGQTVYLKEYQTVSESGEYKYWNKSINPISEDGTVKYIIFMTEDVTEEIMKRKLIEEKYEELSKTIEMKDEMLMLISHELKTPLSIITSSLQTVELVCNNELSDRVRKYLNKIRQNTYRQLKLVNNILDNTRVNAGLFKMNRISVDIIQLTKAIIESISVFAERKGIIISFSTTMAQSIISTDVDIYERILLNLLSNAVKFTPEGKSIEVSIFQMPSKKNPQVCIQVKDNGIGIPNDQKELIFERFGRVERIVSRHSEGTGIGLYLVKMLVALMDGEIKLDSKEGVGSTFSLVFPMLKKGKLHSDPIVMENHNDQLMTASAIEFSDIYYGA
jgi:Signal transduction histidine kinase